MAYTLVGEGAANRVYRREDGTLVRVSKTGADPRAVAAYWDSWRPQLGDYMLSVRACTDRTFGLCLAVTEVRAVCEFKPKWLVQSPAAPPGALSCRTCAIKRMRGQPNAWCALDLACNDGSGVQRMVASLGVDTLLVSRITEALCASRLFQVLAGCQQRAATADAMALRDVTVMVEDGTWRPYIVDLDPKPVKPKWAALEHDLQPFYNLHSNVCRLSRNISQIEK